jgi:hypothetical protein
MSDNLERYLRTFADRARAAGLDVRNPGQNWVPMAPVTSGCHLSLSVARHQIQVNFNSERDLDRAIIDRLERDRDAIEREIGEGLVWERKDGRKKTAIRATLDAGFEDQDWDRQHEWAVEAMRRFERAFGRRLGAGK